MTRDEANDILTLSRHGLESYPETTINRALKLTGDLIPERARKAWERMHTPIAEGQIRAWRSVRAGGNSEVTQ